jgi:hypothetical protein
MTANQPSPSISRVVVERTRRAECFEPPHCASCQAALEPAQPVSVGDDGLWDSLQPDGALLVQLAGGYGMAVDPTDRREVDALTFLLCASCVRSFAQANPWLAAPLRDAGAGIDPT